MKKREEWCIYAALLTGDWKQAYLASHPNTSEDIKPESLYKSVSRWQAREDVKRMVEAFGYEKQRVGVSGRVQYVWNAVAYFQAMSKGEDYPPRVYEPEE